MVAIAGIDVANDNPATPVGVAVGRDYEGSVYVCIDGQCRMTANGLFEFLPDSVEEAPAGARLSRRGAVIPIDHEVKTRRVTEITIPSELCCHHSEGMNNVLIRC